MTWDGGDESRVSALMAENERLKAFLSEMVEEHREGDDGMGSSPSRPTDRPSSRWVRLVGPWRKVERT